MKNHFYISYYGNKRNESEKLFNEIKFDGIDTIIEPFCGSCAISYYISLKIPNLKYILNDNNKYLKEMYEILLDDYKIIEFEKQIKLLYSNITKEKYNEIVKQDNLFSWFIKNKYYNIRPGIFPQDKKYPNEIDLKSTGICSFFRNNNIKFFCKDAIEIMEEFKNKPNCLICLDPPYLQLCNDFYNNPNVNIYEYLYNNDIKMNKSKIYLILEKMWIICLLFKNLNMIEYEKKYEASKKKTTHIIITNI
jgi:hypothetical protein